ncbi:hypothetical protein BC938DRAFT_482297 [Jimgerdemannia flammicorona]|uniref:Signal peptidase complex catalytic subunit SEC11 n=1 Tax=Jimgerdemannia flammicorona TaxID=994334 RepID=A0A433QEE9_9FUNG|nr:hypothetical protein BC938DRAFT_482297 [Jimgerdemannia flammicorona]
MFEFVEMVFMSNFIGFVRSREPTFNVSGWQAATRIKFPSFNYPNYLPAHGHPAPPTMLAAVADQVKAFRQLNKRQIANQILNFVMIIASALMIWKALSLATNSESPIVVLLRTRHQNDVTLNTARPLDVSKAQILSLFIIPPLTNLQKFNHSGSMEPAFYRGDLLFLNMPTSESIKVGDICVFKIPGRDVPIVHRVVKLHDEYKTGKQFLLTKGDNNQVDDRGLYNQGQMWIHRDHVVGKVRGFLPYIGMVTILMNDYPQLKYVLLGGLGLFVLIHRE